MKKRLPQRRFTEGQAIIGLLIAIAVSAILMQSLFTLVSSSYNLVSYNRSRITARHLAQQKMELIKNFDYNDIGTPGGIPNGIVEEEEIVEKNDLNFTIKTNIVYIDDPFDELAPLDSFATDYKRVRIEVSWGGLAPSSTNPIVILSDISPTTLSSTFTGTLIIQVINANGQPVPQAEVSVFAPSLNPAVDTDELTNENGLVTLPGAEPCDSCYEVEVTKSGFSSSRTYSTAEVANPLKPHATVIEGQVTQNTFSIDLLGQINIFSFDSRDNNFAALGGVSFDIRGAKTIGTDAFGQPVYKFRESKITNSSGTLNLTDMEWDYYTVSMPGTTSWDISGNSPQQPINLIPQGDTDFSFSVEPHSDNNLLTTVKNTSQDLIENAYIRLYDDFGFDTATTSGKLNDPDFGQAFFPNLNPATFHLSATASGYLNYNADVDVSGTSSKEIILNP